MEEARHMEVAKKARVTLERDKSNTTCSGADALSIFQALIES